MKSLCVLDKEKQQMFDIVLAPPPPPPPPDGCKRCTWKHKFSYAKLAYLKKVNSAGFLFRTSWQKEAASGIVKAGETITLHRPMQTDAKTVSCDPV